MYLMTAYMAQAYLQVVAPSGLAYTAESIVYTKGTEISENSPIYDGETVSLWEIDPSLPLGMTFDSSTGVISGTPSSVTSEAVYTVTASNDGGSIQKELTITVVDVVPSSLSYAGVPYGFMKNAAISPKSPSVSGGTVVSYSISPSLPGGLSINQSTGVISGTPNTASASTNYTVTASNSGGSTTFTFGLTVTDSTPVITVPPEVYANQRTPLTLSRSSLSAIPKIQNHPIFSEQSQWARVEAIYENTNIPYGDTDRITGVRFRGANSMTGRFKADADSGDVYRVTKIFIRDANNNRLRINRTEFESPETMDITIG